MNRMKHSKLKEMVLVTTLREKSMKRKCQPTKGNNWTLINQLHNDINSKSKAFFKGKSKPMQRKWSIFEIFQKGRSVVYVLLEGHEQVFDLLEKMLKLQ
jgi:hypothetical protein